EAGVPDFESSTWNAISAPPKTPPAIVKLLNEAIVEGLKDHDVTARLAEVSMQPEKLAPDQAAKFVRADLQRWTHLIKAAGLVGTNERPRPARVADPACAASA